MELDSGGHGETTGGLWGGSEICSGWDGLGRGAGRAGRYGVGEQRPRTAVPHARPVPSEAVSALPLLLGTVPGDWTAMAAARSENCWVLAKGTVAAGAGCSQDELVGAWYMN
jgi:hypothetical protein